MRVRLAKRRHPCWGRYGIQLNSFRRLVGAGHSLEGGLFRRASLLRKDLEMPLEFWERDESGFLYDREIAVLSSYTEYIWIFQGLES